MFEDRMTQGAMADIFVNGGLAMKFVLNGDEKARNLYADFRRFDDFDRPDLDRPGFISERAVRDFKEALRQYYTHFFNNTGKFMKIQGVPDSLLKKVIKRGAR